MKFYREFVTSVDGSGEVGKMSMSALHSRLSVLSADSRPPTVTTMTLPRLVLNGMDFRQMFYILG